MGNASKFIKDLKLIESTNHGWSETYVDSVGQQWLKYMVDRADGRYYNLVFNSPRPTTEEMIEVALTSDDLDEIEGASHRLFFEEEVEQKEFKSRLVERLRNIVLSGLSMADKKRLRTIIVNTHLRDKVSKKEQIGKSIIKVQVDSGIGLFAEKLLNQIGAE